MDIVTWGVRGSYPVTDPNMRRYGGNTLCFEVRAPFTPPLILEAGTGLVGLGKTLPREGEAHLFISHMHLDHVQGLPFFGPIHNPNWELYLYLPKGRSCAVDAIFNGCLFPLRRDELLAQVQVRELEDGEGVQVGDVGVSLHQVPHPGGSLAFRLEGADGRTACVIPDIEVREESDADLAVKLLRNADLAIVDAHFTEAEYALYRGWGHTAAERWIELAQAAGVGRLLLSHHAPQRTDSELDALLAEIMQQTAGSKTIFDAAVEGTVYRVGQ